MTHSATNVRPIWRATAVVAALAMLLNACGQTTGGEDSATLTAAERDLRAKTEEQRTTESSVVGVVVGAVVGAVLGVAIGGLLGATGGDAGAGVMMGVAVGGLVGGAVGGAVGHGYGSYMNARAREYSNTEARASAITQSANNTLAHYNQVNNSARTILAEQEAKVAKLNDDYGSRTITKEQFQTALASANRNEASLKEQLTGLETQINAMKTDPQASVLTQQIQSLQAQRDSLKGTYDRLLQLYGTVPTEVRVSIQSS